MKTTVSLKDFVNDCRIPIKRLVEKRKASLEIFRKMKDFVLDNYLEPEKIPLDAKTDE